MKKLLAVLLIMSMSVSMLVGCGGNDKDNSKEQSKGTEAGANKDTEKEDTTTKEDEIDTSIYSEKVELRTDSEKKVVAYYNPNVVECFTGENYNGSLSVDLGEMMDVYVTRTATAEEFINYVISVMGDCEIGKYEESSLSGYVVHYFTLVEPGTGAFYDKIYVLELDAGVALNFKLLGSQNGIGEGSQLEKELAAIKFVVE